jgi:hypothetical protein
MSGQYYAPGLQAMIRSIENEEAGPRMRISPQPQQSRISPQPQFSYMQSPQHQHYESPAATNRSPFAPPQHARRSIYDRTPEEIQIEEDLEIVIEDPTLNDKQIGHKLPDYFVPSWIRYRDAERRKIPFSILIWSNAKKELRDLDELWSDYNGVANLVAKKYDYNPREYFAALLDNNKDAIAMVQTRSGTGIESYRNVLKYLLLYNIKRIHKIVQWDDSGEDGVPIYDSTPNKIFKKIRIQNIFDGKSLNSHEQELINIMNEEALDLYSLSRRPNITPQSSPFIDSDNYNIVTNNNFFDLVNTHFRIFLNRVSIRFWKSLRYNKQLSGGYKKRKSNNKKPVKKVTKRL